MKKKELEEIWNQVQDLYYHLLSIDVIMDEAQEMFAPLKARMKEAIDSCEE